MGLKLYFNPEAETKLDSLSQYLIAVQHFLDTPV